MGGMSIGGSRLLNYIVHYYVHTTSVMIENLQIPKLIYEAIFALYLLRLGRGYTRPVVPSQVS